MSSIFNECFYMLVIFAAVEAIFFYLVVCPNGGMTLIFSDTGGVLDTPPVPSSSA
jgi:hypothetical protein